MSESKFYPYILFVVTFLGVTLGAMNSVLAPMYLPDILKDLNLMTSGIHEDTAAAWINFSFLAGGTVGGILLSFLSDRIGRRLTFALALLLSGAGSGLGILSTGWMFMTLTRFIVGIGVGTSLVLSAVMLSEVWSKKSKGVALGILSVAYPVGIISAGLITHIATTWQTGFLIGLLPVVLILPTLFLLKETLPETAKEEYGNEMFHEDNIGPLISGVLVYGTMLIGLWSAFAWLPSWVQQLIGDSDGQDQRGMAVTLLGLGGLIGGILSGWFADVFGERRVQAFCFVACLFLSVYLFKMNTTFSNIILAGSGLLGFFFGVSQGVLNHYIPALFPVARRASATGLCFHAGRVFTSIAVFFTGIWAVSLGGYGNAIFIFSFVYVLGFIALLYRNYATY